MDKGDHCIGPRKRIFKQTTKKINCPAKVVIREILLFPDYKVKSFSLKSYIEDRAGRMITMSILTHLYVVVLCLAFAKIS